MSQDGVNMPPDDQPYTFRLPNVMVAKLDAYAELLSKQTPGLGTVTRTAAVRVLLEQALAQHEAALQPLLKSKRK